MSTRPLAALRGALLGLTLVPCVHAGEGEGADLPIRRVVLYKHGLGYFERGGKVDGDALATLRFSSSQMNDVLKSLTVLDLSSERVSAIGYDSKAPSTRLLSEFGFELPADGALVAMLQRFRGAELEVELVGKKVVGSLAGVEMRAVPGGAGAAPLQVPRVSLLVDEGRLVSFDASEIQSARFLDADLRQDVRRYLDVLRDSYRAERKSLQLRLEGKGARDVFVAYTVEVPVWKASYRLVLGEPDLLQGWAIVDNTSDEEWSGVELSLVSGLPVSFVQDLYTPRYARRPVVEAAPGLAVAPQTHEGAWEKKEKMADAGEDEERARGEVRKGDLKRFAAGAPAAAADAATKSGAALERAKLRADAMADAVAESGARTRELGDLFEYRIDHPVTVARNRSALVPIVGSKVETTRVSLYDGGQRMKNPWTAVKLKNSTGLTLEGGPVTVIDHDTYAGEALVETLKPGEERYLSFAVDLAVTVDAKNESGEGRVERVRLLNGMLWIDSKSVAVATYAVRNADAKERKVVVEHPRRPNFRLVEPAKPLEETPEHWRFEVAVGGGQVASLRVVEETPLLQQVALGSVSSDDVELWVRSRWLSAEMEKALRELVAAKAELADLERQIQAADAELQRLAQDQERLRKNLGALGSSTAEQQLRGRYVDQLQKSEDRVAEQTAARQKLAERRDEKRKALDRRITELAFENKL